MTVPDAVFAASDSAHREWACNYLSRLLGREVRGGWALESLVAKLEEK